MKSTICVTAQPSTINHPPSTRWPGALSLALGLCVVGLTASAATRAATRYVNLNSPTPRAPYTTWVTAATTIQAAVNAAVAGDEIVVTNGTYATGGRALADYPLMTNRVVIGKAVTVRSVNGPLVTLIAGQSAPGTTNNGDGAIRCVYLGANAILSGFTLTNGHTRADWEADVAERSGGGAWCESNGVLTNCTLTGNSAQYGGGAAWGTLNNCTLTANSATHGGGAFVGTLNNCTLTANSASQDGGGAYDSTLNNCTLTANSASLYGGGASWGTLNNCTLTGNSAAQGGGASGGTLNNCTLTRNSAAQGGGASGDEWNRCTMNNCTLTANSASLYGGGVYRCTLNNCTLTANSAVFDGGGAFEGTLNNCTLTGNSASRHGGGAAGDPGAEVKVTLNNCIVYYNTAPIGANYYDSTFAYSCTTPLPSGPGNMDADPLLASATHLSARSLCIGRGSFEYTTGVDIDGEPWRDPPCMGADQFVAGAATGPLTVAITAACTNVASGFAVSFVAHSTGPTSASTWDFADGVVLTNLPYASHAWAEAGVYPVRLTGYNDSHPEGVSATVLVRVDAQEVYYANGANASPVYPYTTWAGAAASIQEAIDAGTQIGRLVLVSDGVYASGGRAVIGTMINRVVLSEGVEVRSVNGPLVTSIAGEPSPDAGGNGDGAIRCVYVGTNAVLSGFTLTNGHTRTYWAADVAERSGGGAWCESSGVLTNCTLTGNSASEDGGGAYWGALSNCTLTANSAQYSGGGAYAGTLNNCTLTANSAEYGGGASGGTLNNCTLTANSAGWRGGGAYEGTLNNCTLTGNLAEYGGGAYGGTLNNCTLTGNSAEYGGGGAAGGALNNCTLTANSAESGGGAARGRLNNCIVYYNTADRGANHDDCFFAYSCTSPLPGHPRGPWSPPLPRPLPAGAGPGNIDADPLLVSATHLSAQSPCIGRGSAEYTTGVDIDGEPWRDPPCMGADQFMAGAATGPLTVAMTAAYTNIASGFAVSFVGRIDGRLSASAWDFGDGVVVSNRAYASHAWAEAGVYPVRLTGYNDSHPEGVSATVLMRVDAREVYYANGANASPVYPYTTWAGAAAGIQEAIDAGTQIGRLVLVSDGVYASGGRAVIGTMINRVVLSEGVEVRSVNGPLVTSIAGQPAPGTTGNGDGAIRCVYVGANAVLSGFTLTNGHTRTWAQGRDDKELSAGGAWCESSGVLTNCTLTANSASSYGGGASGGTLNNCTLTGNSASWYGGGAYLGTLNHCTLTANSASSYGGGADWGTLNNCTLTANSAEYGGGASGSTLNNCTLTGNSASEYGGGVWGGWLNNCTLTGNSAAQGGGAYGGTLKNCIVYYNTAGFYGNYGANYYDSTFAYSCTTPLPEGQGNIDADPRFVDAAAGDFRLRPDSPCIDAGTDLVDLITTDILGVSRPLDGNGDGVARFDMGAYEFDPGVLLRLSIALTPSGLHLEWPATALGSRLQRTSRLQNPLFLWQEVPGSETATTITMPVTDTAEFYRLVKPIGRF